MKHIKHIVLLLVSGLFLALSAKAQTNYGYAEIPGDIYKTRVYKLPNGLTVMLSVNKTTPQIQTMIAVRAGSKNDPADNTGLAHYLEHMLFKGTENFGTKSYSGERFYLSKIEALYGLYGTLEDSGKRAEVYHLIDSFSFLASKIAIANEYDRMMQYIGATGTNAFTSTDQTVYINNIPANQLERWLKIETDRFTKPVFRLFHTELEAVYEEKNIGLDNDNEKAYDALMQGVFPGHPYGTQTTIGTIEHLKNPSLSKIREYFNNYYKADNMALIMSGDFDPDQTIALIDKYLGQLPNGAASRDLIRPREFEFFKRDPQDPTFTVVGPKEENVFLGFRTGAAASRDGLLLYMTDMILANSQAGLLDIDLNKAQKVQYAVCSPLYMNDYSMHYFLAYPKEGQSLEECRTLVLDELEKLKRGEFDDNIMKAIVDNLRLKRATGYNDNYNRCSDMLDAFVFGQNWKDVVELPERLEKLTKKDIIEFAKATYVPARRATVYKTMGKDTGIQKVPKPQITPIETNREAQSHFARQLYAEQTSPLKAVFPDFDKQISQNTFGKKKKAVKLSHVANTETDYFSLQIRFDMGTVNEPWLNPVSEYMAYIATAAKNNEQISREFFNLACEFGFVAENEQSYIYLKGLNKNFDKAFALLQEIFTTAKVDDNTWQNLVSDMLKAREDIKTNKSAILRQGLRNYARYGGQKNPFTNIVSAEDLKKAKAADIQERINNLLNYQYAVWYYGPLSSNDFSAKATHLLNVEKKLKAVPKAKKFEPVQHKKPVIYFVPYDMVQAEVLWERPLASFNKDDLATTDVFNEYFGSGMYSLVFQTIRESKALAYSTYAYVASPADKEKPAYATAYIGTQADKLLNAMQGMVNLMDTLPTDKFIVDLPRQSVKKQIEAERITGFDLLTENERAQKLGLSKPVGEVIYDGLDKVTFDKLVAMQKAAYQNQNFAICIIGSKDLVNLDELKKYGDVKELSLKDIFGY
jgi:predicted Zn-dependent peptidase